MLAPVPCPAHDPGGKVRHKLPDGVTGGAIFPDPEARYRTVLWRCWGPDGERAPYALFVGMNPSTADAANNDPTCTREMGFTRRWGLTHYRKVNVSAYRATKPTDLVKAAAEGIEIDTLANRLAIATEAAGAHMIVLAFGVLSGTMRFCAEGIVKSLLDQKHDLACLGLTADGSPRHSLYLPNAAPLQEWKGWPV
jgi:hypothetical protein